MEQQRDQWNSRMGFIFAAIGSAVGLGNFWRFPNMAYENGGGAFLIPYFVAILTAGVPLMILEFGFGHKMRSATINAFGRLGKRWEWIGWWSALIPIVITIYYSAIIAWALNYMYYALSRAWGSDPGAFFVKHLGITDGPFTLGAMQWPILGAVALVWFLNYFILSRGISGGIEKACKVIMPVLVGLLFIFVIRGLTLPGAGEGLNFYLTPDFSKILSAKVWVAAYSQVFFSCSIAMGVMIAYSSYLPKKTDLVNNAFITVFSNSAFEFTAGLAVFSTLGYIATSSGLPFEKVVTSGVGVGFVAFPKAISALPMPAWGQSVFGVAFFFALFIAGLSSSISLIEAFASPLIDRYGVERKRLIGWVSVIGFAMSSLYATGAGAHILDIVDHFVGVYGIALLGLVEAVVIGYFYSLPALREHVNLDSDFRIGAYWDAMIRYVTPVLLGYNIISTLLTEFKTPYGGYSLSATTTFGWLVAVGLLVAAYLLSKRSEPQLNGSANLEAARGDD